MSAGTARNIAVVDYPVLLEEFERMNKENISLMSNMNQLKIKNKILLDNTAKQTNLIADMYLILDYLISVVKNHDPEFDERTLKLDALHQM